MRGEWIKLDSGDMIMSIKSQDVTDIKKDIKIEDELSAAVKKGDYEKVKALTVTLVDEKKGPVLGEVLFYSENNLIYAEKHSGSEAEYSKHLQVIKFLLDNGADVNFRDRFGMPILVYAAMDHNLKAVELLLEKGADVNIKNDLGQTALMFAARKGGLDIVKLLVEKGADVKIKDKNGKPALTAYVALSDFEVAKFLEEKGAKRIGLFGVLTYAVRHYLDKWITSVKWKIRDKFK